MVLHAYAKSTSQDMTGILMNLDSTPAYSEFSGGRVGQAYNEAAFRYFLSGGGGT